MPNDHVGSATFPILARKQERYLTRVASASHERRKIPPSIENDIGGFPLLEQLAFAVLLVP